jgi:membrane-associated phospholipid phosphatase
VVPYFMLIGGMYLPALLSQRVLFIRTLIALTVGVLINYATFALFPTTLPRPALPTGDGFHLTWYRWLVSIDSPVNCFPSGHITAPAIGYWALAQEHLRWRWEFGLIFIPFALSILTTKRHYAMDPLGGLATAAIGVWASGRMLRSGIPERLRWVQ